MMELPTLKQIGIWSRQWQQVKLARELQTQIKISDQKIVAQHHQSQTEPDMASLQSDQEKRKRGYKVIEAIIRLSDLYLITLKNEVGQAMTSLGLEPPWSEKNQASGKYQTEDKVLIPLAIRFLRSLKQAQENNFEGLPLVEQDGILERSRRSQRAEFSGPYPPKTLLQDTYDLSFYKPSADPACKTDLEHLWQRIMIQDPGNATTDLFDPKYPLMFRSASVAMMAYLLEYQAEKMDQLEIQELAIQAVWISSLGLLKATFALLNNLEDTDFIVEITKAAFEKGDRDIIQAYMTCTHDNQRLRNFVFMMAILHNCDDVVEQMIRDGLDVNTAHQWLDEVNVNCLVDGLREEFSGDHQQTALMLACSRGGLTIVKQLIKANAEINASDRFGNTALMKASRTPNDIKGEYPQIVDTLIKAGADVNAANTRGRTALIKACTTPFDLTCRDIIRYLIEAGSDINARSNESKTVLMHACCSGWPWRVEALMSTQQNIDLDAIDNEGNTALIWACSGENHQIARHLIEAGANINIINSNGDTALTIAERRQLYEISELLGHHQNENQTSISP